MHLPLKALAALSVLQSQTISFAPPATVFLGQSPLALVATASSGLPVSLEIVSGPASLVGGNLTFSGIGTVLINASQGGGNNYAAAPAVKKSIKVVGTPTALTLLNLTQTYDGSPKPISIIGPVNSIITYGTTNSTTAPIAAGTYPVKVDDGTTVKNGTLIIAKAILTVTPDMKQKYAGQANPTLTASITGFLGSDTIAVLTKAPVLTTTAALTSPGGIYPISASAASALNYTFNYQKGSMVVESFAGSYEALLNSNLLPFGKLSITVLSSSKTFTAKLVSAATTAAVSFTGALNTFPASAYATGTATTNVLINKVSTPYTIEFTLPLSVNGAIQASAAGNNIATSTAVDGRKLLTLPTGKTVNFAGSHTCVIEPALPAGSGVPVGAGWATANISSSGVMTLAGRLGDGTSFTTALSPDTDEVPGYRLFLQSYLPARTDSFFAGAFRLALHPNLSNNSSLVNRRYLEQSTMTWKKIHLATDVSYRANFGPTTSVLMIDPWLPPAAAKPATQTLPALPAITLATRLGLTGSSISFNVLHSDTASAANANLPTSLGLSATNLVSVLAPLTTPINSTKWKTLTFAPTTGTFTGSFELADVVNAKTVLRSVTFSGVLRQPAVATDLLIGDGHYLLPSLSTSSTEKTTGELMFSRPSF